MGWFHFLHFGNLWPPMSLLIILYFEIGVSSPADGIVVAPSAAG